MLEDKEKAIAEGIKSKLKNLKDEHIDTMLNAALDLNVDHEIEKYIRGARRNIEES